LTIDQNVHRHNVLSRLFRNTLFETIKKNVLNNLVFLFLMLLIILLLKILRLSKQEFNQSTWIEHDIIFVFQ